MGVGVGSGAAVGATVGAGAAVAGCGVAVGSTGIAVGVAGTGVAVAGTAVGGGAVVAVGAGGLVGADVGSDPQASSAAAVMVRMAIRGSRYRAWITGVLLCSMFRTAFMPGFTRTARIVAGQQKSPASRFKAERTASVRAMPTPFLEGRNIAESRGPGSLRFRDSTGAYRCGTALDLDQLPRSTL